MICAGPFTILSVCKLVAGRFGDASLSWCTGLYGPSASMFVGIQILLLDFSMLVALSTHGDANEALCDFPGWI